MHFFTIAPYDFHYRADLPVFVWKNISQIFFIGTQTLRKVKDEVIENIAIDDAVGPHPFNRDLLRNTQKIKQPSQDLAVIEGSQIVYADSTIQPLAGVAAH